MSGSPLKLAYTIDEARAATGLSRSTIYNLIRDGALVKVKVRGRTLVPASSLAALIGEARLGMGRERGS